MRVWRSVLGAVLCALVLVAVPAHAQTVAPPDPAVLRGIEAQVSQIRGLSLQGEPKLNVLDHDALHQYLNDQFEREYLPNERESDQKAWVTLGLIKSSDDIVQIQLGLLTDQVVGVYDPYKRVTLNGVRLGGFRGRAFHWLPDGQTLLCHTVVADRGKPPARPQAPDGPTILNLPAIEVSERVLPAAGLVLLVPLAAGFVVRRRTAGLAR